MTYKTHIAFAGALIATPTLLAYTHQLIDDEQLIQFLGALAIGAVAPDIDHASSYISKRIPLIPQLLALYTKHRGFTHSCLGFIIISTLLLLATFVFLPPIVALGGAIGYLLHLFGDAMTKSGIKKFCFNRPLYLLPRSLRFKTGSLVENITFILFSTLFIAQASLFVAPKEAEKLFELLFQALQKLS